MIRTISVVLLSLVAFMASAERKAEYKCWVTLDNGKETISFHNLKAKGTGSAKRLVKQQGQVFYRDSMVPLKKVHECVKLNSNFVHKRAKELDKITPR